MNLGSTSYIAGNIDIFFSNIDPLYLKMYKKYHVDNTELI